MVANGVADERNDVKAIRHRVEKALLLVLKSLRGDLADPAFLRCLPKTSPMPIAVLNEDDCSYVFQRIPKNLSSLLSRREIEVALGVREDLGNKEIGARLGLSPDTVKGHLRVIFTKLGISSRVKLALLAVALRTEDPPIGSVAP